MSTTISTEKEVVWAVFHDDGCECSDLVGVFDDPAKAEQCRSQCDDDEQLWWNENMDRYERMDQFSVRRLTMNEYERSWKTKGKP